MESGRGGFRLPRWTLPTAKYIPRVGLEELGPGPIRPGWDQSAK